MRARHAERETGWATRQSEKENQHAGCRFKPISLQHDSIKEFRLIEMFQQRSKQAFSDWWNLPESEEDFEEAALRACRLVIAGDPRVGKVPNSRAPKVPRKKVRVLS